MMTPLSIAMAAISFAMPESATVSHVAVWAGPPQHGIAALAMKRQDRGRKLNRKQRNALKLYKRRGGNLVGMWPL